jgi:hypothetical protein
MKWIKKREIFLKEEREAKIRDVILPIQAKEVAKAWGEKYLDYEEIMPTENIKQGKWKLTEEDKNKVLGVFFQTNMAEVTKTFESLPDKFAEIVSKSIDLSLLRNEKEKIILKDINIKKPTIDQIFIIYNAVFRKLNVNETIATETIQKDKNGRPVRDEKGNMIKVAKDPGEPIFTNNLVNINTFADDFNKAYSDVAFNSRIFQNNSISNIRNQSNQCELNPDFKIDFGIFGKDMYLDIRYDPKQILNMSISKFYQSCMHLYTGGYKHQLLANVFDPNSLPAFLLFDTEMFWGKDKISDFVPISRMMIRNVESFDSKKSKKPIIFYDRAYPDRMKPLFEELVAKYSDNKGTGNTNNLKYCFTPDIGLDDKGLPPPYMDRFSGFEQKPYIGVNTKTLYLNRSIDWSNVKISPQAKIKELIIETTDVPNDLTKIPLTPDWIKFKYLSINTLKNFDKIKTDAIAFDKCKFDSSVLNEMNKSNPNIKKLQIVSCDLTGDLDFSKFENLKELQIIYTIDSIDELQRIIGRLDIDKLVISGDLIRNRDNKAYIKHLKSSGLSVDVVGPVI